MKDTDIQKYQHELVQHLKKAKCLQTPQVEEAFLKVPRHLFLPDEPLHCLRHDLVPHPAPRVGGEKDGMVGGRGRQEAVDARRRRDGVREELVNRRRLLAG